jgi:hypothetical protein
VLSRRHDYGAYHGWASVSGDLALSRGSSLLGGGLVPLIHAQITGDGPFGSTDALSGLVELSGHVEVAHLGLAAVNAIEDDEGVDLEIGKVEINVDAIEAGQEVNESVLFLCGDVGEEGGCDRFAGGERLVHGEIKNESFGVDVADIDTTLVCEEDGVAFTRGCDTNIIFGVRGVGKERFNNEVVKRSCDGFDLDMKASVRLIKRYGIWSKESRIAHTAAV